jgi:transcriptional regulator with XRE-family HTH domain
MEPYKNEALSVDVGQRLRQLRDERGISMRALARLSNLSANALSMIERGLTSPSVSTLHKLSVALQVPIVAFFRQDPVKQKVVFRKASQRSRISFQRGLAEALGGESFSGRVEAFLLTLETGGNSGSSPMLHTGSELVFCMRGRLEYVVDNESYLLEPGDSLLLLSQIPHSWRNPGPSVVNAIVVISSFDLNESPIEYHLVGALSEEKNNQDNSTVSPISPDNMIEES